MVKRRIDLTISEGSTILVNGQTISLAEWGKSLGLDPARAVEMATTLFQGGHLVATAAIHLSFVADPNQAPATPRRQRRPRAVVGALKLATPASDSQNQKPAAVANLAAPAPKRNAAELDAELTWDARVRSHVLMNQPWSEDWPPMSTCPAEILQRYGVAA